MTTVPCAHSPLDWHANETTQRAGAALVCRDCPIQLTCAKDAIERHERWGVWGGFDFEDITQHQAARERRWAEGATPRRVGGCGTPGGRNRHYRRGEKPCQACADADNAVRHARTGSAA